MRAVRDYHAKGWLPEPARDHSGYRRYDAAAAVDLVKIRTLAGAGGPLSRVNELLAAGEQSSHGRSRVPTVVCALRSKNCERHRERIAKLAAGDSLALPPEVVAYLSRMSSDADSD